jgi:hypothetical protein
VAGGAIITGRGSTESCGEVEHGAEWDEVPERYDRFARWEQDGTWARIEQQLQADVAGEVDSNFSIMRVHQHEGAHCGPQGTGLATTCICRPKDAVVAWSPAAVWHAPPP